MSLCFTRNTLVGFLFGFQCVPLWLSSNRSPCCLAIWSVSFCSGKNEAHRNIACSNILLLFGWLETLWIYQPIGPLCTISLPWQHADDVINLLQPLYIIADIFTADGTSNEPSTSRQGRDSITALVTHNSHTHTHTHTHASVYHLLTKGRPELEDTCPLDTHCACLRRCVSFPMRTFGVFRVEECVLSWSPWW